MKIREFTNIREFAKDRKMNRIIYSMLTYEERAELKRYVYGLQERNNRKDLIWEYLNEPLESDYFIYVSLVLKGYEGENK